MLYRIKNAYDNNIEIYKETKKTQIGFYLLVPTIFFSLVYTVESKAFRLISSPPLTSCLLPLKSRRNGTFLSIFYRYFHANCSSELGNCIPPLLPRPRCKRLSSQAHSYTVQTPYARVNQSFFPCTGKLWNSLPASVFPPVYDLNAFKRGVSRHICNQN